MSADYSFAEAWNRSDDYEVRYTPTVTFNGAQSKAVGKKTLEEYQSLADAERAKATSIVLTAEKSVEDSNLVVQATVSNSGGSDISDIEIWFAAYEDLGKSEKHHVMRKIQQGPSFFDNIPAEGSEQFRNSFDLSGSDLSKVEAVVFLQSTESSMEVLQAALATSA